jgi:hypothetical protein
MRQRPTLLWSPHATDTFAIGTEQHLKLCELRDTGADGAKRPGRSMQLVSSVSGLQQLRCAAWCPKPDQPWTLAVGTAAGKVVLHDCAPAHLTGAGTDAPMSARCEFVPQSQRTCFSMAWNPVHTNQLAVGLDKSRRDFGVLIWDVEHRGTGGAVGAVGRTSAPPPMVRAAAAGVHHTDVSSCMSFDISAAGAIRSVEARAGRPPAACPPLRPHSAPTDLAGAPDPAGQHRSGRRPLVAAVESELLGRRHVQVLAPLV